MLVESFVHNLSERYFFNMANYLQNANNSSSWYLLLITEIYNISW